MEFPLANMQTEFNKKATGAYGTIDDNCADVIRGPRLDDAVQHFANGYLKHLELGRDYPENRATDERAKLLDLHWGRIEHDAAMLEGLGAAIDNLATTLTDGVGKLGESWQGESYEAFKSAMGKICTTLTAYATGAADTGEGLRIAMEQARILYQDYAEKSVTEHLNFGDVSWPEDWHKMTDHDDYSGFKLAECCPWTHGNAVDFNWDCPKNNDQQRNILTGNYVTQRKWDICKQDPCEENNGRVVEMYETMVSDCKTARETITGKLGKFFDANRTLVDNMTKMMDLAVENLFNLASAEAFSSLRVIGAGGGQPVDSGGDAGGGYPGGGGGGGYPGGGGGGAPGGAAEPMQPVPEPAPTETEPAVVEPAATEPPPEDPAAKQPETVEIKDGDNTISVTSPDGEGHVKVTVDDGTGKTKTYELDFDAASGASATDKATDPAAETDFGPEGQPVADAEQVPARTDGKCVIEDGPLTITAERSLFTPDAITLTVDDGSGTPTTYTLDFTEEDAGEDAAPDAATPGQGTTSQPATPAATTATPAGSAPTEQGAEPAAVDGSEAGTPTPATTDSQVTTPQAWTEDQRGSVSGVLVPEQADGEAGLPSAPDAPEPEPSGAAGAGLPTTGASGGSAEAGRAGSGWSVHGDLFDTSEPVYSMHGVLGDDDRDAEQ